MYDTDRKQRQNKIWIPNVFKLRVVVVGWFVMYVFSSNIFQRMDINKLIGPFWRAIGKYKPSQEQLALSICLNS